MACDIGLEDAPWPHSRADKEGIKSGVPTLLSRDSVRIGRGPESGAEVCLELRVEELVQLQLGEGSLLSPLLKVGAEVSMRLRHACYDEQGRHSREGGDACPTEQAKPAL